MRIIFCFCIVLLFFESGYALAFEPIPITVSGTMDKTIFDGKWTYEFEWKASSLNTYEYDNGTVTTILRSAHQDDFVYIFLDPITDFSQDKLNDYAIICFDTKNNKSLKADSDDYCFMTHLDSKDSYTYQGGYDSEKTNFSKIVNPEGFIGISTISDENDRYTPVPHPSYEFRIPTDLIGRESVYGFYFLIYDVSSQKSYTYPQNFNPENFVSSPSQWGEIYSPDKSLPEFYLPFLVIIPAFTFIIFLSKTKRFLQ